MMDKDEFFNKLWFTYPQDLCQGKKGIKHKALKACEKLDPDQFEVILANVEALKRFDRKDNKPDRWPHVSTFINQAYYDREIGSTAELKEKIDERICKTDGCGQITAGPAYDVCHRCTPSRMDARLRAAWVKTGLDRNSPTLANDCRNYCKQKGYEI